MKTLLRLIKNYLRKNCFTHPAAILLSAALSCAVVYLLRYPLLYSLLPDSLVILLLAAAGAVVMLTVFTMLLSRSIWEFLRDALNIIRRFNRHDFVFLLVLLAALNIITVLYSHFSRTIYFWDNAGYWKTSHILAATLDDGISAFLRSVYNSIIETDYNYLIAIPSAVLCRIFGKSHLVFLLGIVNFYVFPVCVLVYTFVRSRTSRPIPAAICVLLSLPALLYLALTGFIDVAAVIPALLVLLLYLRRNPRSADYLLCGALLALTVLLRRYFAFFAVSFLLAAALYDLLRKKPLLDWLAMAAISGFILLFFCPAFIPQRLLGDYANTYGAYQLGLNTDFRLFARYFGVIVMAVLAGCCIVKRRDNGLFLLLQPALCFLMFVTVQSHGQQHLLLYLPAMYYAASLLYSTVAEHLHRPLTTAVMLIAALLPTASCFVPRTQPASISEISTVSPLPSFSFDPPQNGDIDGILELTAYLDSLPEDKQVALLTSSLALNRDLLVNAELSLGIGDPDRGYIAVLPEVDSRDGLPASLMFCDYVVVAEPIQTHLDLAEQQVVAVPAQDFLSNTGIAESFEKIAAFTLGGSGIDVYIYHKIATIPYDTEIEFWRRLNEAMTS